MGGFSFRFTGASKEHLAGTGLPLAPRVFPSVMSLFLFLFLLFLFAGRAVFLRLFCTGVRLLASFLLLGDVLWMGGLRLLRIQPPPPVFFAMPAIRNRVSESD